MPNALLHVGRWLLIVAMFAAFGGHWLVLRSVAWGAMLVDYSRSESLVVAVEKTFDGRHPCGLCHEIQKGQSSEEKQVAQVAVSKLTLFHETVPVLLVRVNRPSPPFAADRFAEARLAEPPVPPPRFAGV